MVTIKNIENYSREEKYLYYNGKHKIKPMTVRAFCLFENKVKLSERDFIKLFCPTLIKIRQEDLKRVHSNLNEILFLGNKEIKEKKKDQINIKNTSMVIDMKYAISKVMYEYKVYTHEQVLDLDFDIFMELFFMADVFKDENQISIMESIRTLHFEPSKDIFNNFKESIKIKKNRIKNFIQIYNTNLSELKNRYKG